MALTLYHAMPSRPSIGRWMLEEVGQPYDVHLLNLQTGEQRAPAYLAINPMGKGPALDHDGFARARLRSPRQVTKLATSPESTSGISDTASAGP
jgi:hypothetical protein